MKKKKWKIEGLYIYIYIYRLTSQKYLASLKIFWFLILKVLFSMKQVKHLNVLFLLLNTSLLSNFDLNITRYSYVLDSSTWSMPPSRTCRKTTVPTYTWTIPFNQPSGFWPCVKSCLVGGSDKYHTWTIPFFIKTNMRVFIRYMQIY